MAVMGERDSGVRALLVHTGQHYDNAMNDQFFKDLGIPAPHFNLGVGSGSHASQTAEVMLRFEPYLDVEKPDAVLVVGDVNSTLACALVAVKKGIPVIHVEAGLRSRDRSMPEEINRILTDQISDLLFLTEQEASANLIAEGIHEKRMRFAGNVMIDTLFSNLKHASAVDEVFARVNAPDWCTERHFSLLTLHRPSNVDEEATLRSLLTTVSMVSMHVPVVFPVHPRTKSRIEQFDLGGLLENKRILLLPPAGYLDLLGLMKKARFVMTDSGGIQEETTALGVPCLTLRENTERPVTVSQGTNTLVGTDRDQILTAANKVLHGGGKSGRIPEYWDGNTARRIVSMIGDWFEKRDLQEIDHAA